MRRWRGRCRLVALSVGIDVVGVDRCLRAEILAVTVGVLDAIVGVGFGVSLCIGVGSGGDGGVQRPLACLRFAGERRCVRQRVVQPVWYKQFVEEKEETVCRIEN